jgi:hypothetical protein
MVQTKKDVVAVLNENVNRIRAFGAGVLEL